MNSQDSKNVASDQDDANQHQPPPPYQEGGAPPPPTSLSSPSQRPSIRRTFRIQYDEGKFPNRVRVYEQTNNLGEGHAHPLYWAKLHISKILGGGGAHMEFKKRISTSFSSPSAIAHDNAKKKDEEKKKGEEGEGKDIGTAKFHKLGKMRVDLKFRNENGGDVTTTTMTGYSGTTYAIMNFECFSSSSSSSSSIGASRGGGGGGGGSKGLKQGRRQMRWKRPGQGLSLVLVDPLLLHDNDGTDETTTKGLARMYFGGASNHVGEVTVFDEELARNERWFEEILIAGLAYVHLFRFLPNYAGGASSIGVGVGAAG